MKVSIQRSVWMIVLFFMATPSIAQHTSGQIGLGLYGSGIKLVGGEADKSTINGAGGLLLKYSFSEVLTSEISVGLGWVRPRDPDSYFKVDPNEPFRTYLFPWCVNFRYNLLIENRFIPYMGLGAGLTIWDLRDVSEGDDWSPFPLSGTSVHEQQKNVTLVGTFGFELFITKSIALDMGARYSHLMIQRLDNIGTDDINTGILEARLSLGFFFGGHRDSDGDGIEDKNDAAPNRPEDFDHFQDEDGVPDPDNDNDGIPDEIDQAPNLPEDIDGFQDEDGIPDMDNDSDGIEDTRDECPNEPEDLDGFQDEDGCPDPDNDQDSILDHLDQCPNEPETFNGYQDDDGCPDEKPESPIMEIGKPLVLQGVTFAVGKADLTENAKTVLNSVIESLRDNPEVRVEIRGYTDNTGSAAINLNLSQGRAEAVKDYFIRQGIAFNRIRAIGYGEANPIASNYTEEGRSRNRRIEFVRINE